MRYCTKCDALINVEDPKVISKTKTVTKKGTSSSGCSMKRFWYCSKECAPKEGDDLPPVAGTFIVGNIINF